MSKKEIDKVNKRFNLQINGRRGTKKLREVIPDARYKVDKELFNLSLNLDINDWREIRGGDFWDISDSIHSDHFKKVFLLKRVKEYLYYCE